MRVAESTIKETTYFAVTQRVVVGITWTQHAN